MNGHPYHQRSASRGGFTLLEVLLVVGILALLAAVVAPNLIGTQSQAEKDVARIRLRSLEDVLNLYRQQNGTYPSTEQGLDALLEKPLEDPVPRAWAGPYLTTRDELLDPWNNPYQYMFPGEHNEELNKPDIWSLGPDGEDATDDDIGNWKDELEGEEYLEDEYPEDADRGRRSESRSSRDL